MRDRFVVTPQDVAAPLKKDKLMAEAEDDLLTELSQIVKSNLPSPSLHALGVKLAVEGLGEGTLE